MTTDEQNEVYWRCTTCCRRVDRAGCTASDYPIQCDPPGDMACGAEEYPIPFAEWWGIPRPKLRGHAHTPAFVKGAYKVEGSALRWEYNQ